MNGSESDHTMFIFPLYSVVLFYLIFLTGITGSILLIIAHVKDPLKLIKSLSSCFMLHIAIADLLISRASAFSIMLTFTDLSHLAGVAATLAFALHMVSFTLYLSLAIQRFFSVAFPLWYRVKITSCVCRWWVIAIWLVCSVLILSNVIPIVYITGIKMKLDLIMISLMYLTFLITQYCNIASCASIRKQHSQLRSRHNINAANRRTIEIHLKTETNFIVTIATISLIVGASVVPFLTMAIKIILNDLSEKYYKIPSHYIWGLLGLGMNSAINVFVYIWRFPKYRKTFKKLYCDCSSQR